MHRAPAISARLPEHPLQGIALTLAAVLCFSMLDAAVKWLGAVLPLVAVVWVRYAVQASVMGAWLGASVGRRAFRAAHPKFQVLRGALLLSTSVLAFLGLQRMPVAEFTAVAMLAPVMVTLLSPLLLREHVSALRWVLVLVAFVGALVIVRPGSGLFGAAALYPLALALAGALFQIVTRRMATMESPLATHFYTGLVGTLLMTAALPFSPVPVGAALAAASGWQWALMLFAGLAGTVGHLAFIRALGVAPMAVLMPFTYAQLLFAALWSAVVFAHRPDAWAWGGMLIIGLAGGVSVWLNVRSGPRTPVAVADSVIGD